MNKSGLKVTIEETSCMITDTYSTILGFAASRAILSELKNLENENDLKTLEELVFSNWNYDFDSLPNFSIPSATSILPKFENLPIFAKKSRK